MKKSELFARVSAGAVGAVLLVGVAGAAFADTPPADPNDGNQGVAVNVNITPAVEPGVLAMTVAGTSTSLTESGSTPTIRQFTGNLPTVTVTDTRVFPERLSPNAYWYVLGTSSDFTGDAGQPAITAGHLGWTPTLGAGTDPGQVAAGDQVKTVLDSGPDAVGLVDQELLAIASSSRDINPTGSWSVNAGLFLKTPITVATGSYSSTLTLSLFEFQG